MQTTQKLFDIATDRRKALKKDKEKQKMRKSQQQIIYCFYFFIQKNLYIFRKHISKIIRLQFIVNAEIKHQHQIDIQ